MSYATTLADPSGSSALVAAVHWLEATLLGTIATTIAVICVACVGVMMLNGRVNFRHGITTILGCFLLFGAASIAAGVRLAAESGFDTEIEDRTSLATIAGSPFDKLPPPKPRTDDPYAGASVRR